MIKHIYLLLFSYCLLNACTAPSNGWQPKAYTPAPALVALNDSAIVQYQQWQMHSEDSLKQSYLDAATVLLEKAFQQDKHYNTAAGNLVLMYSERGEKEKMKSTIQSIVAASPDFAEWWQILAICYDLEGDTVQAFQYYNKSNQLFEDRLALGTAKEEALMNYYSSNLLQQASGYMLVGDSEKALKRWAQFKTLHKDEPARWKDIESLFVNTNRANFLKALKEKNPLFK